MASNWRRNGVSALVVFAVGAGAAYMLLVGKSGPVSRPAPQFVPPTVTVQRVQPALESLSVETQGTVRPLREINLVSQVAGRVIEVAPQFAGGGFFVAGEQLLRVEDEDYRFAIARAESQVASARQRVAEEKGRALQASREWRDLGSEQANDLFLRKPQLASAQSALLSAKADLGAAQLNLERTVLSVPFNGRISEKHVDLGQYVAPGTTVARVYDTDVAQVRLPLTDRQVALLDLPLSYADGDAGPPEGAEVVFHARFANREWQWHGRIVRTDASIDVNSRVVYAVAEIEKPFARQPGTERPPLSPGLFVNATISGRSLPGVVSLPRKSLRSDDAVMVVDAQQRAQIHPVKVLYTTSQTVWVQGLGAGDRVIVGGRAVTVAGTEVTVKDVGQLAAGGE